MPKSTIALESPASARRYKIAKVESLAPGVWFLGLLNEVGFVSAAARAFGGLGVGVATSPLGSMVGEGIVGATSGSPVWTEGLTSPPRFPPECAPEDDPGETGALEVAAWTTGCLVGPSPQYEMEVTIR